MSQNAEALQRSCGVTEEEEEDMHEALDSSKRILNHQSSNFLNPDDELLSWLQYPIDDDIFHHWPPPLTTSPAPPASADFLSSFPTSFSSSFSVKHLPQLENDAFTAAKDSDRRAAVDDWILQKEDAGSEIFQGEQSTALKNRGIAFAQEGASGVRDYTEAYHFENRGDRRAGIWANRLLDYKQGFAKESRNLAQVVASKGSCQPMHSPSEKAIWLPKEQDTSMMLPTHSTQHEEERGLQREAKAQEEKLLQFGQASNEDCWLKKDMDMDLKTEEQATITGRFQVHSNADAALALGAGRAAGIIQPPGMEAFSKVRTSLQPTQHVPLGSPVSSGFPLSRHLSGKHLFTPAFCNWTAPASRPLGSSGSIPVSQLSYQTGETKLCNAAQCQISRPSAHYSSMGLQENQLNFNEMSKIVKSTLTTATLSETLPTVTLLSPQKIVMPLDRLQDTSIPEETMARGSGSSNAAAASDPGITDMQKLSSVSFLSQERTTGTCSGGSQTSGSLRETVSGIKRKVEDSECVSEEAEEESVVSSQARTSTSKRPRANEVHNLSERKRRNRINDKMNALRELIPNASKSNKAALLDEAIDYLKNLQLQLQVMSLRTGVSLLPMVLPPSMPHMPIPQYVRGTLGMDMSEGSTLASTMSTKDIVKNKTYAAPVRPFSMLGSVSGPLIGNDMRPLRPLAASHSFSQYQAFPSQPLHPHMQAPSQIGFPINSNICNNLHKEQQQQQQTPPTSLQPQERKEEQLQQQHQQQ